MHPREILMKYTRTHRSLGLGISLILMLSGTASTGKAQQTKSVLSREYFVARGLFEKLWVPGDASLSGGDGVGPLYNERSCVGCHNLGGTGGAGDNTKNVVILSALPGKLTLGTVRTIFQGELEDLHPGFRNRSSIVLHLQSTSGDDRARLAKIRSYSFVQSRDDVFALSPSQRSTPALFGAGRIDAISDKVLLAAEGRKFADFPEIKGRVSRVRGGRLGKFGWKGQTASLEDFVMAACANELGLEVRGHHQASLVTAKNFDPKARNLDLSDEDCARMIRFVANLPAPIVRPVGPADWGAEVFAAIGCATCHSPSMGDVHGIYSDLLLHDLGDRFRAFGGGYGGVTSEIVDNAKNRDAPVSSGEAGPTEWRTTPLWGVANSAPYLHDGRATTLHEAIILHGGEAELTSKRYASLSRHDRQALLDFLLSQVAPSQPGRPVDRSGRLARGNRR